VVGYKQFATASTSTSSCVALALCSKVGSLNLVHVSEDRTRNLVHIRGDETSNLVIQFLLNNVAKVAVSLSVKSGSLLVKFVINLTGRGIEHLSFLLQACQSCGTWPERNKLKKPNLSQQ